MELLFEKWHACKNDFIVLRITEADGDVVFHSLKRQAPALCDRYSGIGADGLLVLWLKSRDETFPYQLSIINSDGSIAQNCGNGLRCAASSVLQAHRESRNSTSLLEMIDLTVEGVTRVCRFMKASQSYPIVAVDMGIPLLSDNLTWWTDAKAEVERVASELGLQAKIQDISACEIGNRHLVISTSHASRELVRTLGPKLQQSKHWDGINVHVVSSTETTGKDRARAKIELGQDLSEMYQAYVWERGAGETMACGSGAVAIGTNALLSGLLERDSWVGIDMPGGRLYVKQESSADTAILAGPATYVFKGKVVI